MIKTILVPVDFSENSFNAAEYALQLANIYSSDIILFHAYDIPLSDRKVASPIITIEEIEHKIELTWELFKKKLLENKSSGINITSLTRKGDSEQLINQVANETNADLIVMGIVGMSRFDELFIGSVASAVMHSSSIPVLLIPGNASFSNIENIVFALDTQHLNGSEGLTLLKEIAKNFQAKVLVLNIHKEGQEDTDIKAIGINLPAIFVNDMNYSISFQEGDNVVQGIQNFAEEIHADMIAMIPHKHSLIERLFSASNTQKVAYNSKIPLLALPDRNNH